MRLLAGLLQIMPVLGEIHGSMYLGERHGSGRHASSHTSIYRCYRSCLPSLPGEEGRWWSRLSSVIWCAYSLLVTPREGAMVATSSRVELQCPASIDSPGGEAPSLLSSLMRKLVEVPPENPLDLFPKTPSTIHPQSRTNATRAPEHNKRKHDSTPSPGPTSPPHPSTSIDGRSPTPPSPKPLRKEGWAGGGVGLVWFGQREGGSEHTHSSRGAGWGGAAPARWREEQKKREKTGKDSIPIPKPGANESFWGRN